MSINDVIVFLVAIFFLVGCFDKAFLGGKLGLGPAVESGVAQIAGLIFFLVGIMVLVPVIVKVLTPIMTPIYGLFGADPGACAGIFIGPDAGGYAMAAAMTENEQVIALSGIFLSSMLGLTLVFALPWGLSVVPKEDREIYLKGVLCGIVASPIGTIVAGLCAGMNFIFIIKNLIPAIILIVLVAIGILKAEKIVITIFSVYSKIVVAVAALAVGFACFEMLTGKRILPGIDSIGDKLAIMGSIGISMGGALALVFVLQKLLKTPLASLGGKLKINDTAMLGLVATMANSMPVISDMYKGMDTRGKLYVAAFTSCVWCALGSHLAFTSTVMPQYLVPMIIGKLAGGIAAILLVNLFFTKRILKQAEAAA